MLSSKLAQRLRSTDHDLTIDDVRGRSYPTENGSRFRHWESSSAGLQRSLVECNNELVKLADLKIALTTRLRALGALLSPIRWLSDDDLSCIFTQLAFIIDDPSDRAAYFARTICKVCFRWNSVARTMVDVWAYLNLQHNRLLPAAGRTLRDSRWAHFHHQASLCNTAPLHVKWDYLGDFQDLSHFASAYRCRFASLVVYMPWADIDVLASDGFQSLRRLEIVLFHSQGVGLAALGSILGLEHLSLCGDGLSKESSFEDAFFCLPSLRYLRIDVDPPLPSSYVELSLAGSSFNLVSLHIKVGLSIDYPAKPAHPIILPSLADLLLERNACALMWRIFTPALKSLFLRDVNVREDLNGSLFGALHAMLDSTDSSAPLTTFSLSNVSTSLACEEATIRPCLHLLSNVTTIFVAPGWTADGIWNIADILAHMLTVTEETAYMPNLQEATFSGFRAGASRSLLRDFCLSRSRAHVVHSVPVQKLRILYTDASSFA
ncbi:hypothetical protein EV122DRAFT_220716 [Schizophyllum commune]